MKLETLAKKIDKQAKQTLKYLESEESVHADFCMTFDYGDSSPRLENLNEELEIKVQQLKKKFKSNSEYLKALGACCDLQLVGIFIYPNEIHSIHVGEYEDQLDEKLANAVKSLSKEDQNKLRRLITEATLGYSCPDCIYISQDYERWVMILNEEKLDKKLKQLNKKSK